MSHRITGLSFPFYLLEPGKPDPNVPLDERSTHPRVMRSEQEGPTCWYSSIHLIYDPVGKNFPLHCPECQAARKIEIQYSTARKKIANTPEPESIIKLLDIVVESVIYQKGQLNKLTPGAVGSLLPHMESALKKQSEYAYQFLKDFSDQEEFGLLGNYLQHRQNLFQAQLLKFFNLFFKNNGIRIEDIHQNEQKKQIINEYWDRKEWKVGEFTKDDERAFQTFYSLKSITATPFASEPLKYRYTFLRHYLSSCALQDYGFKETNWKPSNPIKYLINDLSTHGPLYVAGHIGPGYYSVPPTVIPNKKIKELTGRLIYGWQSGDKRKEDSTAGHAIVVISAQPGGAKGGFVFFVDPNDSSDPNDPEAQKIYVYSYENFTKHVAPVSFSPRKPLSGAELSVLPMEGYAFYCSKKVHSHTQNLLPTVLPQTFINVDVGFGNTLGIRVEGSWDTTVPFTWTPNGWTGDLPVGKEYKFVKVMADGALHWEKREGNRFLKESCGVMILNENDVRF